MFSAFFRSWAGWFLLAPLLLQEIPESSPAVTLKRFTIFVPGWLGFGFLNALHWLGFLLDEVFFSGYRQVKVSRPIEVVGIPRSGTTFLHRALATEPRFTTLTLLECVLAPSITERYIWFGARRLFGRLFTGKGLRVESMEAIHPFGLDEPEEDFLLLLWVHACFLITLVLPESGRYWRLARFDEAVPDAEREVVFDFYYRCLQRHLFFHGADKRLLSKNPSFTPMLRTLRDRFPDATIVGCMRPPVKTVPSQLSSLLPAFTLIGDGKVPARFSSRMIDTLRDYYVDLNRFASTDDIHLVEMARLNSELEAVVSEIFELADHEPSDTFSSRLTMLAAGGRSYQSAHRYSASAFGLTEEEIDRFFSGVWPLSLPPTQALEHQ